MNFEMAPRDLFHDMILKLKKSVPLHAVILFGSRATGKATNFSDYDVVIIGNFQGKVPERVKMVLQVKPRVPLDVFCFTPEEFDRAFREFDLTAIDAIGEGIVLFGERFLESYNNQYNALVQAGMRKKKAVLILPS